jgi:RimJ/RimL family protein N-acetyltransferase
MFVVLRDPAIYEFENSPPSSLAALQERYAKLEARVSPDGTQQWLNWVVRLGGGQLAGYMQATVLPEGRAYVAYELASRFWRQGIAGTALSAVLGELASTYEVRQAYAILKAANYRSAGLLKGLGFTPLPAEHSAWAPEPDELVMYKAIGHAANTA